MKKKEKKAFDYLGRRFKADELGRRWDETYEPAQRAGRTNIRGTGGVVLGVKTGRAQHKLSMHESKVFSILEVNPRVLHILEGYQFNDRAVHAGPLPSLDFAVAIRDANDPEHWYRHGFSVKESSALNDPKVIQRLDRDRAVCEELGWGWNLVTEKNYHAQAASNAYKLRRWLRDDSLEESDSEAYELAKYLNTQASRAQLVEQLYKATQQFGHSTERTHHLFAWAAYRGYLEVDSAHILDLRRPLILRKPGTTYAKPQ